ncbi:hypothetical protein K435DRAFT_854214 [Dendrothele bispora CBS 962.96]|uniref:Uncharacterized protein n=1 Tax=Dendrothele bispora (strain CBS 962.96) TaxID=1314807 RepID=A0A4V4HH17_DENBC|nr:hypothetical protein K435DRAFT_854214 [Dendrothele bispora CBS 962.96]
MASPVQTRSSSSQARMNIILDRNFPRRIFVRFVTCCEKIFVGHGVRNLEGVPMSTLTGAMTSTTTTTTTNERDTGDIVMSLSREDARSPPPGPTSAVSVNDGGDIAGNLGSMVVSIDYSKLMLRSASFDVFVFDEFRIGEWKSGVVDFSFDGTAD